MRSRRTLPGQGGRRWSAGGRCSEGKRAAPSMRPCPQNRQSRSGRSSLVLFIVILRLFGPKKSPGVGEGERFLSAAARQPALALLLEPADILGVQAVAGGRA